MGQGPPWKGWVGGEDLGRRLQGWGCSSFILALLSETLCAHEESRQQQGCLH